MPRTEEQTATTPYQEQNANAVVKSVEAATVATKSAGGGSVTRIEGAISARNMNLSKIYTPWSKWSRCKKKKCKQVGRLKYAHAF